MQDRRILIIDEDVEARRMLRDVLNDSGWQVDEAADCLAGLELINEARAYGSGFNCIVCDLFLPDLDGKFFLGTLRRQYPELPFIVLTGYGDESSRQRVEQLAPAEYLEKPLNAERFMSILESLDVSASTHQPEPPPAPLEVDPEVVGYVFVKFDTLERAGHHYAEIKRLDGVISANALKGNGSDLVMRVGVSTVAEYKELHKTVNELDGVSIIRDEQIVQPPLSRDAEEFVRHFRYVAREAHKDYVPGAETNAYLMIDIDRYQLERIYMSVLFTEGVIRCRVVSGLSKLIVLASGVVRPNVVRHLLRKLAQMDGIRRVREVTIVNMGA